MIRLKSIGLLGRFVCLAGLLVAGGCMVGPRVLTPDQQVVVDRKVTEYPSDFALQPYLTNRNCPSRFCFDELGNLILTEGGYDGEVPRIFGIRPYGTRFNLYPIETRIP